MTRKKISTQKKIKPNYNCCSFLFYFIEVNQENKIQFFLFIKIHQQTIVPFVLYAISVDRINARFTNERQREREGAYLQLSVDSIKFYIICLFFLFIEKKKKKELCSRYSSVYIYIYIIFLSCLSFFNVQQQPTKKI